MVVQGLEAGAATLRLLWCGLHQLCQLRPHLLCQSHSQLYPQRRLVVVVVLLLLPLVILLLQVFVMCQSHDQLRQQRR